MHSPMADEALAFVRALNAAWTRGAVERLTEFFHPQMVAVTATDRDILYGRDACLASWERFARTYAVSRWEELDPVVTLFGNTAVVTYRFDMAFSREGGTEVALGGRDMFVLVKEDGRWWAVADQFSAIPPG